jgi:N-acetylgalactosamine kinase
MLPRIIGVRKVQDWLQLIRESDGIFEKWLKSVYDDIPGVIQEQKKWYEKIVLTFANIYSLEAKVIIARAPARINLVGMHIDHRGGHVNPIAAKDMVIVAQPRDDDKILLHDIDAEQFLPRQFRISNELPRNKIKNWLQWTELQSEKIKREGKSGDWAHYAKAAALYLQELYRDSAGGYIKKLKGMNALVAGTIPIAAGLGSSSALVVASAEALARINNLNFTPEEFVGICGTAEWYVGTRGGFGDHAAIKLSQKGYISRIGFFPLQVDFAPFLNGYRIAICHTHKEAKKAAWAKSIFNERVATYEIGLMLLKRKFPRVKDKVQYFRDLTPKRLGIDEAELYEMLKSLPTRITREELLQLLGEEKDILLELFRTHDEPEEGYRVRGVCLFGLAECERAELATSLLESSDMKTFGELISLSHEGDRVTRFINGKRVKCEREITDEYLDKMIADLRSDDTTRIECARLYRQPGDYAVSCEALDELVDIAMSAEGVLGAGRVGAGLGGCISVLVDKDKTDELIQKISVEYYHPKNLPPAIEVCFPIAGSGIVDI